MELGDDEHGRGALGRVMRGNAYNCYESLGSLDVLCNLVICANAVEPVIVDVKMLNDDHSEEEVVDLALCKP